MKTLFLICLVAVVSSSAFAINLKCTSSNDAVMHKDIKFISDQKVSYCPDRIGLGSTEEQGMTIFNLVYVKKDGNYPSQCLYHDYANIETSCTFVPQN